MRIASVTRPFGARLRLTFGVVALVATLHPGGGTWARAADQTLVAAGSDWRYDVTGADRGTAWRSLGYDDTSWPSGLAQLGYGDGDEATVLADGGNAANRHPTYYFRRTIDVAAPAAVGALQLRVKRDDGCVVYVNGAEVMRSNMPAGEITYGTLAVAAIGGADEDAWLTAPVDPALLVAGPNVIAVEIHQNSPASSDVTFDLELVASLETAVAVALSAPADEVLLNGFITTLSADVSAVAGLARATLLVGGAPTTSTFTGAAVVDAQITAETPATPNPAAVTINVDGQAPHAHGLLGVPDLVGVRPGQVRPGARVLTAALTLTCTNSGAMMALYRLTEAWEGADATWQQRTSGVPWGAPGADGAASRAGAALPGDCTTPGVRAIDVTRIVQEWADGAPNHGLVLIDSGTDGIDFSSSEGTSPPALSVTWRTAPSPAASQTLSGTSATAAFRVLLPSLGAFTWNVEAIDSGGLAARGAEDFRVAVDWTVPDVPLAVSPADGATGVALSTRLDAVVAAPAGGAVTATAEIRRASPPGFTIVVLPDTQHYSEGFPAVFTAQTQWIAANQAAWNIVFVTHEGDIVQNYGVAAEWQRADASMRLLDGVVPYGLAPGNHDQPSTLYNQFFPYTRYQGLPWYGGHYGTRNDNNYQLFSGGGLDFVAVHLEFCPPPGAVAWAKSVFDNHPARIGMVTTHGYLNAAAQRTVHGGCANTQYLWDSLGAITPNLHFMLSGHVHDEARRSDVANGHPVHQMLADYQDRANGGDGWLRLLRFVPAENRVHVKTYSPWRQEYETDANSEFTLDFPMTTPFTSLGTAVVPSGATASFTPAELQPLTAYEWRVTATSGGTSRVGPVWRFTTGTGAGSGGTTTATGRRLGPRPVPTAPVPRGRR